MDGSTAFTHLVELLAELREQRFPFAQLRPKPVDPATCFSGDYDFVCEAAARSRLVERVDATARRVGASWMVERKKPAKLRIWLYDAARRDAILTEFWSGCVVYDDRAAAPFTSILPWRSLRPGMERSKEGFVLGPGLASLIYLTHLHAKRKSLESAEVQARLAHFSARCRQESGGDPQAGACIDALIAGRVDIAGANRDALDQLESLGYYAPVRQRARALAARIQSAVTRTDRLGAGRGVVAVVGPDGAGKTTLIDRLVGGGGGERLRSKLFKSYFRESRPYPRLKKFNQRRRGLTKNQGDERMAVLLFAIALLRFHSERRTSRGDRRALILDRYFYDLMLVGLREPQRQARRVAWWRLGALLAPRPHGLFVLDLPYEVARARKDEIAESDWQSIHSNYRAVDGTKPPYFFACCRTDASIEDAVSMLRFALGRIGYLPREEAPKSTSR